MWITGEYVRTRYQEVRELSNDLNQKAFDQKTNIEWNSVCGLTVVWIDEKKSCFSWDKRKGEIWSQFSCIFVHIRGVKVQLTPLSEKSIMAAWSPKSSIRNRAYRWSRQSKRRRRFISLKDLGNFKINFWLRK